MDRQKNILADLNHVLVDPDVDGDGSQIALIYIPLEGSQGVKAVSRLKLHLVGP